MKGSQDQFLYQSYREGDIEVARSIANGIYDITFHFAEPEDIEGGERLFDVIVNDQVAIAGLDVMAQRDGQVRSALTVTAPNIRIDDEKLRVRFDASARQALLSALVVRKQTRPGENWQLVWSDEFDVDGPPNPDNWNIQEWAPGVVNSEDQAYTARSKNVRVEDGHLIVEAFKEDYDGADYTSGRIHSSGSRTFCTDGLRHVPSHQRGRATGPQSGCCRATHSSTRQTAKIFRIGKATTIVTPGRIPARSTFSSTSAICRGTCTARCTTGLTTSSTRSSAKVVFFSMILVTGFTVTWSSGGRTGSTCTSTTRCILHT